MASSHLDIIEALDSIADKKKAVQKSFSDLESQRRTLLKRPYDWKELNDHFVDVENALRKKYEEFVEEQKVFEGGKKLVRDAIEKQSMSTAAAEQASIARVQQQKDAAVKVIVDHKRKWNLERQKLESQIATLSDYKPAKQDFNLSKDPAENDNKDSQKLAEQDANVKPAEKVANNLKQLAEQQDANVSRDVDASKKPAEQGANASKKRKKPTKGAKKTATKIENATAQVIDTRTKAQDTQTAFMHAETGDALKEAVVTKITVKDDEREREGVAGEKAIHMHANVEDTEMENDSGLEEDGYQEEESLRCSEAEMEQLKTFCRNMDGLGLKEFLISNRKLLYSSAMTQELSVALKCAADPGGLVLKALQGYNKPTGDCKRGKSILGANQRAMFKLLEALKEYRPLLSSKLKEEAKAMADKWKSNTTVINDKLLTLRAEEWKSKWGKSDKKPYSLYAESFLQLLDTFGLALEYDEDYLCRLIYACNRRTDLVPLLESLGLTKRVPDVIEMLLKDGKILEALSLAQKCSLLDHFQPAPLLKAFLKEARKTAREMLKGGNDSPQLQVGANIKELSALRIVLKGIHTYDLEVQFPSSNIQKRIAELEALVKEYKKVTYFAHNSKNRQTEKTGNSSEKKPKTEKSAVPPSAMIPPTALSFYPLSDRPSHGVAGLSSFIPGMHPTVAFGGASRGSFPLLRSNLYSADGVGSTLYGPSGLTNPLPLYSPYQYGPGTQRPMFQGSYLH